MCVDGQPVVKRGVATVFDLDKKLLRDWEHREDELKSSLKGDVSYHTAAGYSLSSGMKSTTAERGGRGYRRRFSVFPRGRAFLLFFLRKKIPPGLTQR